MKGPADTPSVAEPAADRSAANKPRFVLHLDGSIEPVPEPINRDPKD